MTSDRACPRCHGGDVLAVLRVPHGWTTARGNQVQGSAEVLLCARCDADGPVTGPIVAYFAVHELVSPETLDELASLLRDWIDRAKPPELDENALAAEVEAWYRGDL
ncbi:DUF6300 family protein [Nonomuraea sp. NPDC005983]|uniref:DUF6300 family protein n=1 Tax=Nonomuraea sp. NPDC005983 TaxID=3155595 RepID=UPI0033B4C3D7